MKQPILGSVKPNLIIKRSEQRNILTLNSESATAISKLLFPNNSTNSKYGPRKKEEGFLRFSCFKQMDNESASPQIKKLKNKLSFEINSGLTKVPDTIHHDKAIAALEETKTANHGFKQLAYKFHSLEVKSIPNSRNQHSSQDLICISNQKHINVCLDSNDINTRTASNVSPKAPCNRQGKTKLSESFVLSKLQLNEPAKCINTDKAYDINSSDYSFDDDEHSSGILKNCINKIFDQESEYLNLRLGDIESELNRDDSEANIRYRKSQKRIELNVSLQDAEISINDDIIESSKKKSCLMFKVKKSYPNFDHASITKKIHESEDLDNSKSLTLVNESNYTKNLHEFADELETNVNRNALCKTVGKQRSMMKFDRSNLFTKKIDVCFTLDSDIDEFNGSKDCGEIKTGRFKTMIRSVNSETSKYISSNGNSPPAKKKSTFQC